MHFNQALCGLESQAEIPVQTFIEQYILVQISHLLYTWIFHWKMENSKYNLDRERERERDRERQM
jgi:hypothetical protein